MTDPNRPSRDNSGKLRYDLGSTPTGAPSNFTVKRKKLPPWATPGVIVGGLTAFVMIVLVAIPLFVDTDDSYLAPTLILLAFSVPTLAFTGYRILFGESAS